MRFGSTVVVTVALLLGIGAPPAAAQETVVPAPDSERPAPRDTQDEALPCDGCPPRRVGMALLQATGINVVYEIANLVRGQVTAHITPVSWWENMQQGWVWDLDDFTVNQIGHPYQGNNYFNA